jgi:VIT1/CCC1 family predicted Fe2+/Mn2+ transporter
VLRLSIAKEFEDVVLTARVGFSQRSWPYVLATAVPAALPFLLIADGHLALRTSNALLVALLFLVGYLWGQHVGAKPWLAGCLIMSVGATLALVAIPLGG